MLLLLIKEDSFNSVTASLRVKTYFPRSWRRAFYELELQHIWFVKAKRELLPCSVFLLLLFYPLAVKFEAPM